MSSAVGGAGAPAAADPNFNGVTLSSERRGRLWWQLQQTVCPTGIADSHIPFVQAQLVLLEKTVRRRIASFDSAAASKYVETIFSNRTISFTSLNIKGIQVAFLFNFLLDYPVRGGIYGELAKLKWEEYDVVLGFLAANSEKENLGCLLIDETPPCIPLLNNKAIVVLLGVMTLEEIVWSIAQNVYFIGLVTDYSMADGAPLDPVSFLSHDMGHMQDRFLIGSPESTQMTVQKINVRINHFLHFIGEKSEALRSTCLFFLFLYLHHEIRHQEQIFLRKKITMAMSLFEPSNARILDSIILKLSIKNDLGGLLPVELHDRRDRDSLEAWLRDQWIQFMEEWNRFLGVFAENAALPSRVSAANGNMMARTLANAKGWAGGRRRKTRRKTRR